MLTEKGYRDRFWQGYPQLRRVLEGKERSLTHGVHALLSAVDAEDGPRVSTDHGTIGQLGDVLCIGRLLAKHHDDVQGRLVEAGPATEALRAEVTGLVDELESRLQAFVVTLSRSFERDIESLRMVVRDIDAFYSYLQSARKMTPPKE